MPPVLALSHSPTTIHVGLKRHIVRQIYAGRMVHSQHCKDDGVVRSTVGAYAAIKALGRLSRVAH